MLPVAFYLFENNSITAAPIDRLLSLSFDSHTHFVGYYLVTCAHSLLPNIESFLGIRLNDYHCTIFRWHLFNHSSPAPTSINLLNSCRVCFNFECFSSAAFPSTYFVLCRFRCCSTGSSSRLGIESAFPIHLDSFGSSHIVIINIMGSTRQKLVKDNGCFGFDTVGFVVFTLLPLPLRQRDPYSITKLNSLVECTSVDSLSHHHWAGCRLLCSAPGVPLSTLSVFCYFFSTTPDLVLSETNNYNPCGENKTRCLTFTRASFTRNSLIFGRNFLYSSLELFEFT